MKTNRICFVCGKAYYFCRNCNEGRNKPSWMQMFCCEDCKDLNTILSGYTAKKFTIEEAKELIDGVNTKDMCKNNENTQNAIKEIMAYRPKKTKVFVPSKEQTEEKPQVEEEPQVTIAVEETAQTVSQSVNPDCEETKGE